MEGNILKIKRLRIKKLHGYIDYNIQFNNDITFLYGENGCGKTTILNIMTSIITGRVYELARYQFFSIILDYSIPNSNENKQIQIANANKYNAITMTYNGRTETIDTQKAKILDLHSEDAIEIEHLYFNEYKTLSEIKKEFNYIYLPLNRNGSINGEDYYHSTRKYYRTNQITRPNIDITLLDVSNLVKEASNKINYSLSRINEKFSEELLKSFLDVENIPDTEQIITHIKKLDSQEIKRNKTDYSNVLKTIKKWDIVTEKKINVFFDSLLSDLNKSKEGGAFPFEILFKISELNKINNIIRRAEEMEKIKNDILEPLTTFLHTVNSFINDDSSNKKICIDDDGQMYLKTRHSSQIDLQQLSSGEKQIITFFAYLIFGLQDANQSIFIVDEPEISLHLQWQIKFVDTILDINPNIQLIFATHSPEIIGRHRDKATKLIPNY